MGRYIRSIFSFISESQRVYPDWDLLQKRLSWLGCTDSKEIKFCLGYAKCKGSIKLTKRQIPNNGIAVGDGYTRISM